MGETMKATCVSCQRQFEASELYVKMVQAGKLASLCGACDNSHDDDKDYDEEDI